MGYRDEPPNRLFAEASLTISNGAEEQLQGNRTTMRFHIMVAIGSIATLSFTASADAQGVPGGIAHGVSVGNQTAGPVGAVVGGVVGGFVGGVEGVLGIEHRVSYPDYPNEYTQYRPHRIAKPGVRYSRHIVRHPSSAIR
jgi:hypothetical protein